MNLLILGNLISLVGCVLMVFIGFVRKKQHILGLQCIQFGIMCVGNLVLGAIAGSIAGVVGIVRNLIFSKTKGTLQLKLLFIGIQTVLSWNALQTGWLEWLPLCSNILFTCFLDIKSERLLKVVLIFAQLFWLVYDLCYHNYVAATFDALTVLSNFIGIFLVNKTPHEG